MYLTKLRKFAFFYNNICICHKKVVPLQRQSKIIKNIFNILAIRFDTQNKTRCKITKNNLYKQIKLQNYENNFI